MEENSILYILMGVISAIFAIIAPIIAYKAMNKGLTYTSLVATLWTLMIIGIARVWHLVRELLAFHEWAETVEYSLYLLAYILFIWLILKTKNLKTPKV